MRFAALLCLIPAGLFAAIEGTVINGTTGKPEPSVKISLVQPGANGMQAIATSTSDASGKFSIDHDLPLITRDADFRHFAKHCGLKLA